MENCQNTSWFFFLPSSFTETIIFEFPFLPFFCNAEARSSFEVWSSPKGWFCRICLWVAFYRNLGEYPTAAWRVGAPAPGWRGLHTQQWWHCCSPGPNLEINWWEPLPSPRVCVLCVAQAGTVGKVLCGACPDGVRHCVEMWLAMGRKVGGWCSPSDTSFSGNWAVLANPSSQAVIWQGLMAAFHGLYLQQGEGSSYLAVGWWWEQRTTALGEHGDSRMV